MQINLLRMRSIWSTASGGCRVHALILYDNVNQWQLCKYKPCGQFRHATEQNLEKKTLYDDLNDLI